MSIEERNIDSFLDDTQATTRKTKAVIHSPFEKTKYNSIHFVRYIKPFRFNLEIPEEFEKFAEIIANMMHWESCIKYSPDLKFAIVILHVEVESNPETIPQMPISVRKLYDLGEFAKSINEHLPETNQPPNP